MVDAFPSNLFVKLNKLIFFKRLFFIVTKFGMVLDSVKNYFGKHISIDPINRFHQTKLLEQFHSLDKVFINLKMASSGVMPKRIHYGIFNKTGLKTAEITILNTLKP